MAAATPAPSRTVANDALDERVRRRITSLDPIFNPRTVAVVAEGSAGNPAAEAILASLSKSAFEGKVFAVALEQVATSLGIPCFSSVAALPSPVDLAVVAAGTDRLPDTLRECVAADIKGAILTQPCRSDESCRRELYSRVEDIVRNSRMRVLGPNCSVLQNPVVGLNASCGAPLPVPGTIALISQSGALCHAVLEWSFREIVGFSVLVSIGGMVDVNWGDLIDYFGADPNTRSIILFMESMGDARSFLSAAREVALNKPIIAVKAGASDIAGRIIAAHTDLSPGSDEVLDAAFRRAGVLRVNTSRRTVLHG
jgi:acetyltransferase